MLGQRRGDDFAQRGQHRADLQMPKAVDGGQVDRRARGLRCGAGPADPPVGPEDARFGSADGHLAGQVHDWDTQLHRDPVRSGRQPSSTSSGTNPNHGNAHNWIAIPIRFPDPRAALSNQARSSEPRVK